MSTAPQVTEPLEPQPSPPAEPAATEPTAPPAGAEPRETPPEPPAEPGEGDDKSQKGINRRFAKMSAQISALESERDHWRTRALGPAEPAKAPADAPKPKPNPADFETTEAYLDARDAWILEEADRKAEEKYQKAEQAREQRTEQEILVEEFAEREEAFKAKTPDFEEVVDSVMNREGTGILQLAKGPGKNELAELLCYSEFTPQILHYFGKNPEEVQKACDLAAPQVAIYLGRIVERLAPENEGGEGKTPPQTRAPKPPNPVRKPSAATTPFDPTNPASYGSDFSTYKQQMDARELAAKKK